MGLLDKIKSGWNAFVGRDPTPRSFLGPGDSRRPDRPQLRQISKQSIIAPIYNRIAMDAAKIKISHIRKDKNDRYIDTIDSSLNRCLNFEANLDQTGRALRQDAYMSMLDEGVVAIVPTDTKENPYSGTFQVMTLRTGKILEWYPEWVKILAYNERKGKKEVLTMPKRLVAIVENPLYAVMNEYNSTLQRLIRKLTLLDIVDEQTNSGKLNIIIGLPYVVKTEARKKQAEQRRAEIEAQLTQSKYGIAYTDGTEHITQLNRALESNLLKQIEYLQDLLYGQLGMTKEIFAGNANEETMLNYYERTIEPIVAAIVDEMNRKFISKTAWTQKQSLMFFRDPFGLIPIKALSEIVGSLKQAEIITSNEARQALGYKPDLNSRSDELNNPNINPNNSENDRDESDLDDLDDSEISE